MKKQSSVVKNKQLLSPKWRLVVPIIIVITLVLYITPFLLNLFTTDYNAMVATKYSTSFGGKISHTYPEGCFGLMLNISENQRCFGYKTLQFHYDTFGF